MRRGFHDQRRVHAGGCSMMRDLWRLTRRTPLSLFTSAVALGYTALLVEVLVFAALDPRGSFSFRGSFVLSGVVSVPAVIVALVYALRASLRLRQPAWNVLLQLGLSERRIRGYLLRENALIALAGLLGGIIVLQPVWWVLLRTVYAPYREMGPESLTLSVPGAAISIGVLLGLVLPAHLISTRRIREPVTHVARTRSRLRGFAKTAGFIVAVVTLGILFYGSGFDGDPGDCGPLGTVPDVGRTSHRRSLQFPPRSPSDETPGQLGEARDAPPTSAENECGHDGGNPGYWPSSRLSRIRRHRGNRNT